MTAFPTTPVAPREFIEEVIPAIFADLELDEVAASLDLKLGILLTGEGGGGWTLHFTLGELGITEGVAEDCALTVLQSVTDWRSGLWEGRPGLIADAVEYARAVLATGGPVMPPGAPRDLEAFRELEKLSGRIDAIVEGQDEPDWGIGLKLGAGSIPETADATIRIGSQEAEALRRGQLHPLEALITGQLRLEGDLGLILQLQAIVMAASIPQTLSDGSRSRRAPR